MTDAPPTDPPGPPPDRPRVDLRPHFTPLFEATGPLDWAAVFPESPDAPVELDVGAGRGAFTRGAAACVPGVNFAGVEIDFTAARRGAKGLKRDGVPNGRLFGGDARRFLGEFVPAGSVAAVHVLYPDPWWKRRHRKRRLLDRPFLDQVATALTPGGRLHVRTDVGEYFQQASALLAGHAAFMLTDLPEDPTAAAILAARGPGPLTNYERKATVRPDRPDFQTDGVTHKAVWECRG